MRLFLCNFTELAKSKVKLTLSKSRRLPDPATFPGVISHGLPIGYHEATTAVRPLRGYAGTHSLQLQPSPAILGQPELI